MRQPNGVYDCHAGRATAAPHDGKRRIAAPELKLANSIHIARLWKNAARTKNRRCRAMVPQGDFGLGRAGLSARRSAVSQDISEEVINRDTSERRRYPSRIPHRQGRLALGRRRAATQITDRFRQTARAD